MMQSQHAVIGRQYEQRLLQDVGLAERVFDHPDIGIQAGHELPGKPLIGRPSQDVAKWPVELGKIDDRDPLVYLSE